MAPVYGERWRIPLLVALAAAAVVAAAVLPPVAQDPAYHRMADERRLWGVPNALNVLSNAAFVAIGAAGLAVLGRRCPDRGPRFVDARERGAYVILFGALVLLGLGSAYYHLAPDNHRLLWDRLPLASALMALFDAAIAERVGAGAGLALLLPLQALGLGSVLWWYAGELRDQGDLRLYGLVQFFPLFAIPLLALLFPARYTRSGDWLVLVGLYLVAKLFEVLDGPILGAGGLVSGHTLKHLMAAAGGYWILRMLMLRRPGSRSA